MSPGKAFTLGRGRTYPTCGNCGKVRYATRKEARKAARAKHPGESMHEYRCSGGWHIAHTPAYVKAGVLPRQTHGRWW